MPSKENKIPNNVRYDKFYRIKKDIAVGIALFATFFGIAGKAQSIKAGPKTVEQAIEELSVPAFKPKKFPDLPSSHPAFDAIETLYYGGVIKGYPDGTAKPDKDVTRAEFATMLVKEFGIETNNYSSVPFKDVGNHWARKFIAAAYENGLIKGYPDGTFRPNENVTKAEALTMIVNAEKEFGGWVLTNDGSDFSDVKSDKWYYSFIETAVTHGVVEKDNSYIVDNSNGNYYFHPNEKSLRGQNIIFLYKIAPKKITDPDGDGLPTEEELAKGTNPKNPDTDDDGIPDGRDKNPRLGVVFTNPKFSGDKPGNYKNYETFKIDNLSKFPSYKGNVDSKTFSVHTLDELVARDKKDPEILKINPNSTFYYLYYKTDFYKKLTDDTVNYIMKKYPTGVISLDDVYEYFGNKIFEKYKELNPDKPYFSYGCGDKLFGIRLILNEIFERFADRTFEIDDQKNGKIYKYKAKDLYVADSLASSTSAFYIGDGKFSHAKLSGINHVFPLIISKDAIFYTTNFGPTSKIYAITEGPLFEKRKDYNKFQNYVFDNHLNVMAIQADTIEKHRPDMFYNVKTPAAGLQTFSTFNMDNETFENVKIISDWPTYKRATGYLLNNDIKDVAQMARVMSSIDNLDKGKYLLLYGGNGYFIVKISNSLWEKFKEQYKKNPNSTGVGDDLKIIYSQ